MILPSRALRMSFAIPRLVTLVPSLICIVMASCTAKRSIAFNCSRYSTQFTLGNSTLAIRLLLVLDIQLSLVCRNAINQCNSPRAKTTRTTNVSGVSDTLKRVAVTDERLATHDLRLDVSDLRSLEGECESRTGVRDASVRAGDSHRSLRVQQHVVKREFVDGRVVLDSTVHSQRTTGDDERLLNTLNSPVNLSLTLKRNGELTNVRVNDLP